MKKLFAALFSSCVTASAWAHVPDLVDIFHDAQQNDPQFQQALANRDFAQQNLPLQVAALLPQINLTGTLAYNHTDVSGNTVYDPATGSTLTGTATNENNQEGFTLSATQTIFNFTNWMGVASARNSVKAAYATYTAAVQTLIQQTVTAYFQVLLAEETLADTEAEKRAFYRQYIQAKESYEVGVTTITDMYNAKASYESAMASVVAAENNLLDDRENLRVITGHYYPVIAGLQSIPLTTPDPADINVWSKMAMQYNWSLIAAHYTMLSSHDSIEAAFGGHLPSVDADAEYEDLHTNNTNSSANNTAKQFTASLNLNIPIFSGGEVTAQVKQAIASYDLSAAQYQQTYRDTINSTRQAYLGAISGISKLEADKQAIVSNEYSLQGMEEGYKVGTQTMTNVLIAESELYDTKKAYESDRNDYIVSLVNLKQAAGTLNVDDVIKLNSYLNNNPTAGDSSAIDDEDAQESASITQSSDEPNADTSASPSKNSFSTAMDDATAPTDSSTAKTTKAAPSLPTSTATTTTTAPAATTATTNAGASNLPATTTTNATGTSNTSSTTPLASTDTSTDSSTDNRAATSKP